MGYRKKHYLKTYTMKKLLLFAGILLVQYATSQNYYPFPTGDAYWNNLTWAQWNPDEVTLYNSQYSIVGDTILNGLNYKRVFYYAPDLGSTENLYIGGLREDNSKNIYFFPNSSGIPSYSGIQFPSDTSEFLLYTFNNLVPGMILPINQGVVEIKVLDIDSVLVGNSYRKRYMIQDRSLGPDYWIEGIGSTKDLFMSFTYEFEWSLNTLCFTDTTTYHISWPYNGQDSCHYSFPTGISENVEKEIKLFPNPSSDYIVVEIPEKINQISIELYNIKGQMICQEPFYASPHRINISQLSSGKYFALITFNHKKTILKFTKE